MQVAILHPTYFPTITQFVIISQSDKVLWEAGDNFQKQTYRNRLYLFGANGKQMLNIPIQNSRNSENEKRAYREVYIDNSVRWQRNHLRTLETAYRRSAYYEYFEEEVRNFYSLTFEKLIDCNLASIELVLRCLRVSVESAFHRKGAENQSFVDYRRLTEAKNEFLYLHETYFQSFADRHGFITNLSILDLLFNLGSDTWQYLLAQKRLVF